MSTATEEYTEIKRQFEEQSPKRGESHKATSVESSMEIWDFGGQLVYHSVQRLFLTPAAVYFVVLKLTDDLDAPVKISDACSVPYYSNMTNLEFLLYLIRSIFTHAVSLGDDCEEEIKTPKVFIVGTHRDSISSHEDEIEEKVNEIWGKIQEVIDGKAYKSLVYPQLFDIDNKQPSTKINELKKIIWETKEKMPVTIPLNWLKLQMGLQEQSKTNVTMTYEEVKVLASTFGIEGDKSTTNVLTFLHDLGQVLFFPEVAALKENVVINPLMLVDMYKTVNTVLKPEDLEQHRKLFNELDECQYCVLY
ncbi:uncharacterized protein LOC117114534 [Anneissia japonica]|uniref:uncharacterized protein LOC117114534 n=1 Tax=Anneissia japonica TaxID=1529436 RepID=UPI0014256E0B|nr:uncharacterized protein LOC117114534 [Anneissia japonica]